MLRPLKLLPRAAGDGGVFREEVFDEMGFGETETRFCAVPEEEAFAVDGGPGGEVRENAGNNVVRDGGHVAGSGGGE